MASSTSTLANLAPAVQARLQDPNGVFWLLNYEIYSGLSEAISELLLILGRPTATVSLPVSLTANTVWQPMPSGLLAISNLTCSGRQLWKTTLHSLDYTQTSWSSAWESDRAALPARWAPLGLNYFVVHPAPLQPITVTVTGIAYPFTDTWPPAGTDSTPFHKEFDQALELYAASYARIKEIGQDFQEGLAQYQAFLEIGQRMSQIEDRKDSLVWTRALGTPTAPSQVARR
jgi:hypothetical protein